MDSEVYYETTNNKFVARIKLGTKGYRYKYLGSSKVKEKAQKLIDDYIAKLDRPKVVRVYRNVSLTPELVQKIAIEASRSNKYQYQVIEEALEYYFKAYGK